MSTRRNLLRSSAFTFAFTAMAGACARPDQSGGADLASLDAVETAARIRNRTLSAEEAVEAAISRAKRIEPHINAIVTKTFRRAMKDAPQAQGPWAGVPTFIKDLDDVTGVSTQFGTRAFPGYHGKAQTPLTNALFDMGLVSLGKSSTPEFGLSATTEPVSSGPTRNPWNTDYSVGGSSGGAAALVAAGVVPIAHASDGGGSIRIPASCCGTVGLKVSRGRYPEARPNPVEPIELSVHGVQSRTVRDTAAVTAALELSPEESGLKPVGLVTGPGERRLKIGFVSSGINAAAIDREVQQATENAAAICESLGHQVEPFMLALPSRLESDFLMYWGAIALNVVQLWERQFKLPRNSFAFEPFTLGLARYHEENRDMFAEAIEELQKAAQTARDIFTEYDVLLTPVLANPPPKIGHLDGKLDYDTLLERLLSYVQFTSIFNVSGNPAISLPLSMSRDGLPIGAMFAAGLGDEKTLLELAYELEEAAPWSGRKPKIFG